MDQQQDGKGCISASDHMARFNQRIGFDGWMQSSAVMRNIPWNVALVTWRVVGMNNHVDTAEDDAGLDDIWQKALYSHRCYSSQCMQQLL
ncbi:predicted protein [Lichtheimia corymbifera JMRC:FSU:9682]|uniref:Uncharacterized protein n=1 Tax=Lichtheimia corymbifera JMRC:FSU:9682 TaxID=1263082 RepID=A0A068RJ27_9FUNG|nr:predicted protein [Lichtheimia corymbifera JMRC:FSU:9682]